MLKSLKNGFCKKIAIGWCILLVFSSVCAMQQIGISLGIYAHVGHLWHNEKDPLRARFGKASLHECIDASDMVALKDRLDNGADINLMSYCGSEFICTPLCYAIHTNKLDMALELINRGADVNKYCNKYLHSYPPLLVAMKNMSQEMVPVIKKLVFFGANLNNPLDTVAGTVLTFALHFGPSAEREKDYFYELVQFFFQENTWRTSLEVNIIDSVGRTALWWAVFQGNVRLVEILCQHGAQMPKKDVYGKTLKDYANKNKDIIDCLDKL